VIAGGQGEGVRLGVGGVVSESGVGLQAGGIGGKGPTGAEVRKVRVGGKGRHVLKSYRLIGHDGMEVRRPRIE
jgi:hypothetical protein